MYMSKIMKEKISGLHHVTAIATDPQRNVDFYTNVLGLRLVKKTVNFDDPQTYHLYYGDETGTPGSILTFFPWSSLAHRGRKGSGQASAFSFSIPKGSLEFWQKRLTTLNVTFVEPANRFGDQVLMILDHDEFEIHLVATDEDSRVGWSNGDVPLAATIRGFHGVTLSHQNLNATAGFIQAALGAEKVAEEGNRHRYQIGQGGVGTFIDVLVQADLRPGTMGAGIIHHVAFRTPDDETQLTVRDSLSDSGQSVTDVADRQYFKSIYFREPSGVLFEVVTDTPGFMTDETKEELGTHLKLPPWLEDSRREIETVLPAIHVNSPEKVTAVA